MEICILGDISVDRPLSIDESVSRSFQTSNIVIANLEGLIADSADLPQKTQLRRFVFHNHPSVVNLLHALNVKAVSIANNHTFDLTQPLSKTTERLTQNNIRFFGAGTALEAAQPFHVKLGDTQLLYYAFGWEPIGCPPATKNRPGVNPLIPTHVLGTLDRARMENPDALIIFQMHWGWEFEPYPQPAHRQLAHDLIALGVDAVVGMHPHVIQGVEMVQGRPILYGLGNWFVPPRTLGDRELRYPETSKNQLCARFIYNGRTLHDFQLSLYHFDQDDFSLKLVAKGGLELPIISEITPFASMSHEQYITWFRRNRVRRKGLPVYTDYNNTFRNVVLDHYVRARHQLIRLLVEVGLK